MVLRFFEMKHGHRTGKGVVVAEMILDKGSVRSIGPHRVEVRFVQDHFFIGVLRDTKERVLHICLLPTISIKVRY